ncbi:DUF4411 family protein [Gemmatimonas sp.]
MTFVIDTNSLAVLKNFYPATFGSLWLEIDQMVLAGELVSVEEVLNESERRLDSAHINAWIERNKAIFSPPTESPRDSRRLHFVRRWSHGKRHTVLPRGA